MSTPQNTDKLLISRGGTSYSITYGDINLDASQALSDAASAQVTADASLPKTGGTMTGPLVCNSDVTINGTLNGNAVSLSGGLNGTTANFTGDFEARSVNVIGPSPGIDRDVYFYDFNGNKRGRVLNAALNNNMYIQNWDGNSSVVFSYLDTGTDSWNAARFRTHWSGGSTQMSTNNIVEWHWNNGFYYRIDYNPGFALINSSPSDPKLKNIKGGVDNASDIILALNPIRFAFKNDCIIFVDPRDRYGFNAEELQEVLPEAVEVKGMPQDSHDGETSSEEYLALATDFDAQMVAVLTKALQEALARIEALESRIKVLENS